MRRASFASRCFIRLCVVLASIVITVAVFEVVLRLGDFYPHYRLTVRVPGQPEWSHILKLHPGLLFTVKADGSGNTEINNFGYRDRNFAFKKKIKRVLVLGDSFIMGNNVSPEDTIPARLDTLLGENVEVFNMGIAGYGPDQIVRRYLDEGKDIESDVVVLSIFAGNDFRDLGVNRILKSAEAGRVEWGDNNPVTDLIPTLRTAMLIRLAFGGHYLPQHAEQQLMDLLLTDQEEGISLPSPEEGSSRRVLMRGLLSFFSQRVISEGRKFLVLIIPGFEAVSRWQKSGETERFLAEHAVEEDALALGISFCSLLPAVITHGGLSLYDPEDRHFTERGTTLAAEKLASCVREAGLLSSL